MKNFNAKEFKKKNDEDRMKYLKSWANYVKDHPDKDWKNQQNKLINSQLKRQNEINLTRKEYLKIKQSAKN
ncbi:MAG: hypothetical protein QF632_03515 [Candidatus Woesearchaeota archaeon]|jgi:hypothetical protein|nr:hypothetical protein [Candidatus Woesearchaeota archaeon]MDP7457902.1 hypothetical protein [Candidatus Woesearchaeota archaeon]|tara:strand:+ start:474 stop:686 length:213 start_codon:yes stop_codon:yes gene_type:complete